MKRNDHLLNDIKVSKNNDIYAFNQYIQNSGNVLPYMLASLIKNSEHSDFSSYIKKIRPFLDDKSLKLCFEAQKDTEELLCNDKFLNSSRKKKKSEELSRKDITAELIAMLLNSKCK